MGYANSSLAVLGTGFILMDCLQIEILHYLTKWSKFYSDIFIYFCLSVNIFVHMFMERFLVFKWLGCSS